MSRRMVAALAVTLAVAAPVWAQTGPERQPGGAPQAGLSLKEREQKLQDLQARRSFLVQSLPGQEQDLRSRRLEFTPNHPEVVRAEKLVEQMKKELAEIDSEIADLTAAEEKRFGPLRRPVNLELKNATLRQAAEALTQVSGTRVRVDPAVPEDTRLTLDANAMPLANVLAAIAGKTVLMIAPTDDGVLLKRWPSLAINGLNQVVTGNLAPWSDEWERRPTTAQVAQNNTGFGGGYGAVSGAPGGGLPGSASPYGVGPGSGASLIGAVPGGTFSVTAMGDRLVVAQTGAGGIWLTVYRFEGMQLKRVSSTFHSSAGPSGPGTMGPPGAAPGYPGNPMNSLPGAANPQSKPQPGASGRRR